VTCTKCINLPCDFDLETSSLRYIFSDFASMAGGKACRYSCTVKFKTVWAWRNSECPHTLQRISLVTDFTKCLQRFLNYRMRIDIKADSRKIGRTDAHGAFSRSHAEFRTHLKWAVSKHMTNVGIGLLLDRFTFYRSSEKREWSPQLQHTFIALALHF
jgi:hypothetical protein